MYSLLIYYIYVPYFFGMPQSGEEPLMLTYLNPKGGWLNLLLLNKVIVTCMMQIFIATSQSLPE